ncbi:MAG: hypothetical protein H0T46_18895 [Deltaproteobacteria bacterium]|nr:hypothetical protein [Deltaproteobacteria bacterium]
MRSLSFCFVALLASCATDATDGPATDDIEAPDEEGKVDSASELSVRVSGTTLWMNRTLERRGNAWVLRGRTSRNITDGHSFIFDDVFGEWAQRSARTFEVVYDLNNSGRTVPDGVNLFTSLSFVHSSSRPDHLTARVTVRPRVSSTTGPSSLALTAELTPIVNAGHTVYRLKGRSTKVITSVAPTMGTAVLVDPTHFTVDLDFDQLQTLASPDGELAVTAQLPTGPATIRAKLGLVVKKLGMTSGDVEAVFPSPQCTSSRRSCLAALPDGALDLSSCGEAVTVRVCQGQIGVTVDAAALASAKAASDAKLTALATDAVGLVGAGRAADLTNATREVIAGRLAFEQGAWLLSATARNAVLATATQVPLDDAYAYPLSFVDGIEPVPGDLAVTRNIATDAILGYLKRQDYVNSEFGRSYLELTKVFRAQHVASLKEFREASTRETFGAQPGKEFYIGRWIGTHTEVTIDSATGEATHVLVEID